MPECKTSVCVKLMYILFFFYTYLFIILMNRRIASSAPASATVIMPHLKTGTVSGECGSFLQKSVCPHMRDSSLIFLWDGK